MKYWKSEISGGIQTVWYKLNGGKCCPLFCKNLIEDAPGSEKRRILSVFFRQKGRSSSSKGDGISILFSLLKILII